MKKILKTVLTAVIACMSAVVMSICVSAETEDLELPVDTAVASDGAWGQSITYNQSAFDCSRLTPESIITVGYELDGTWTGSGAPIELIFQNYSTADPQIWAKIEPFELDTENNTASFRWNEMVQRYGSEDFSGVDNMWVGDCGIVMTVTKLTITNCTVTEVTTTEAAEDETTVETTAEITEAETTEAEITEAEITEAEITEAPETTPAPEATTAADEEDGGGINTLLIIIVIVTVVVAVGVVATIIILKNRRGSFY